LPIDKWIDAEVGWDILKAYNVDVGAGLVSLLGVTIPFGFAVIAALELAGWTPSKVIRKVTGIDFGNANIGAKPALQDRASELGPILSFYDVCCLCEVWTDELRQRIEAGLGPGAHAVVSGPGASPPWKGAGSGLCFIANR